MVEKDLEKTCADVESGVSEFEQKLCGGKLWGTYEKVMVAGMALVSAVALVASCYASYFHNPIQPDTTQPAVEIPTQEAPTPTPQTTYQGR